MNRAKSILATAGISLAIAFSFSCSKKNKGTSEPYNLCDNNTALIHGSLTDSRDSKRYKTIKIGSQIWMAENLSYNADGSVCYDNSESHCDTYGRLYSWDAAMKDCPKGWHLPSYAEWTKLTDYIGGAKTAGVKLRAANGWSENGNGMDCFDFSALPGGDSNGNNFYNSGYYGFWWSSTEGYASYAYSHGTGYYGYEVYKGLNLKTNRISVRCVQD